MKNSKMTLNFIQNLATPHNNILLKELEKDSEIELNIWYCYAEDQKYGWKGDLSNEIKAARFYKSKGIDLRFIRYCLKSGGEKYFLVGWMNPTTKLLILLFWMFGRPFNIWFDYPQDGKSRGVLKHLFREVYYFILKRSCAKVFCVGKLTVEYFKKRGFDQDCLVNLPIFIDTSKNKQDYLGYKDSIYNKYNISKDSLFLTAGSRLVYEKGFDILIEALARLEPEVKSKVKCVIVGKGDQRENLDTLIRQNGLKGSVYIEEWMDIEKFKALIANSDVFIHPARFDAYGGTIFAMSLGVPVVGSKYAGAAYDRIIDNKNGHLYNGSLEELGKKIHEIFLNQNQLHEKSEEAYKTALKWPPEKGESIIKEKAI